MVESCIRYYGQQWPSIIIQHMGLYNIHHLLIINKKGGRLVVTQTLAPYTLYYALWVGLGNIASDCPKAEVVDAQTCTNSAGMGLFESLMDGVESLRDLLHGANLRWKRSAERAGGDASGSSPMPRPVEDRYRGRWTQSPQGSIPECLLFSEEGPFSFKRRSDCHLWVLDDVRSQLQDTKKIGRRLLPF